MKTVEVKLYEISELSDKAKQKAIDWYKENQFNDDWQDWVIDEWKTILDQLGYPDTEIAYSGFWSQGDGCSFTVSNFHPTKRMLFLAECKRENYDQLMSLCFKIKRDRWGNHVHWNTVSVYLIDDVRNEGLSEDIGKLIHSVFEDHHNLSDHIYKALENAYEYENKDEYIIENITCNEYLFLEDGTKWRET